MMQHRKISILGNPRTIMRIYEKLYCWQRCHCGDLHFYHRWVCISALGWKCVTFAGLFVSPQLKAAELQNSPKQAAGDIHVCHRLNRVANWGQHQRKPWNYSEFPNWIACLLAQKGKFNEQIWKSIEYKFLVSLTRVMETCNCWKLDSKECRLQKFSKKQAD